MAECIVCGAWAPDDKETGYAGPDICPSCKTLGFTVTAQGEIVNERTEAEAEDFAVNGQDVRR